MRDSWDECGVETQALIIAFDQVMVYDEERWQAKLAGAKTDAPISSSRPATRPARHIPRPRR